MLNVYQRVLVTDLLNGKKNVYQKEETMVRRKPVSV